MMKRLPQILVSVALLLPAPAALAAYDSPADLLKAIQTDATPRSMNAEMHLSYTAEDDFFLSAWVRGRSQGRLADAQGESSATIDIAMPSDGVNARIKARARVVDQTFYGLLESVAGRLGEDEESVKASMQEVLGKWVSMKLDPALAKKSGIDYSELFNEGMLRMERTQGKDGSMYSITIDREFLRGILALGSSFDPSLDATAPEFNFHAVVITDHQDRIKNARVYVSLKVPDVSFVLQASSEALPTGFKIRVPANAIPMDAMMPSFSEGGPHAISTDPRASGTGRYDARAAARAIREQSTKRRTAVPAAAAGDLTFGDPNAPVTITEYTDYQCPFCLRFQTMTFPMLKEKYIDTGKARLVIRHYPLSFHEHAMDAALAVKCAQWQGEGKGRKVSDAMWILQEAENQLTQTSINKYALMAGDLDASAYTQCIAGDEAAQAVRNDIAKGDEQGVVGTPSFHFSNASGQTSVLDGAFPFEDFQKAIDALLK